ncbi:MAG TPA: DUF4253 domain-containing protein [Terriglobia bacterium]|nr:DUF4253 domain-containing protein [Terriglobia bacterium]
MNTWMKNRGLAVILGITVPMLSGGCLSSGSERTVANDPTETLPAKYKTQEPVEQPDFRGDAESPEFQQAIMEASSLLGAQPQPLVSPGERENIPGGVSFDVPGDKVGTLLHDTHLQFLAKGYYLFRYEQNFGLGDRTDKVGLLPTTDKYAVMAVMETNGDNYNIGTSGVIAWMKDLEKDQPFVLTGIGFDYMEGHLSAPVKDAEGLARRMYEFTPDIVDQGVGSVDKLADELEKGTLYFWWD